MQITSFNYTAWQEGLGLTDEQAAGTLDISLSFYRKLKKDSGGRKVYAWAAYGVQAAAVAEKARA